MKPLRILSHPAWGAWIEIYNPICENVEDIGRTPHGVRGLKFYCSEVTPRFPPSHPAWGAWIEITHVLQYKDTLRVAPRMGCVD